MAWWHGVELGDAPLNIAEATDSKIDDQLISELGKPNCKYWTPPRMALTQTLFGEGMTGPGGDRAVAKLASGLHLNPSHLLVEYGAGLGGVGFTIARRTGCRLIGLEPDEGLVKAASILAFRRNLENRANIRHPGDGLIQFKPGSIDAIVSKEQFVFQPQKAGLFAQIARTLKPQGQIAFTDLVLGEKPPGNATKQWIGAEAQAPRPVRVSDLEVLLDTNGLEIERSENITDEYQGYIVDAFNHYGEQVDSGNVDTKWKAWALAEGQYWQARLDAIEEGAIAVHRFVAHRSTDMRISDFFK